MNKTLLPAALVLAGLSAAPAAEVTWGAYTDYGVGTASGSALPVGDLVELGSFGSLTPAQIAGDTFSQLQAAFTVYSATARHIGDGSPVSGNPTPTAADDGFWEEGNDTNSTTTLNISGLKMYFWVFNGSTVGSSTQEGIFTAAIDGATPTIKASWTFPADTAIPPTTTVDLDQVLPYTTGRTGTTIDRSSIIIGGYGTGTANGLPLYNLAPIGVPEPSTLAVGAWGILAVGWVLRRGRLQPSRADGGGR